MSCNTKIPHIYKPLLPIAWLYEAGVWMRNKLFDRNILPVEEFSVPIISVGNLAVGGTGKTPFIEYLIELLSPRCKVAVLSRGYRRKSRGYVMATPHSTPGEIGDEPYQIYSKYPHVAVAVDANRRRGIKRLMQEVAPQVILLDDAHQHRYVRPTLSIVLSDYNRPPYADYMLPAGRLREPLSGLKRADVVVITKCDHNLNTQELHEQARLLHFDAKSLYAAHIEYGTPYNILTKERCDITTITAQHNIIILTGIANPTPMQEYISHYTRRATLMSFPDHHNFTPQEVAHLAQAAADDNTIVITTEKDAARLSHMQLPAAIARRCYILPMRTVVQAATHHTPIEELILQSAGITQH